MIKAFWSFLKDWFSNSCLEGLQTFFGVKGWQFCHKKDCLKPNKTYLKKPLFTPKGVATMWAKDISRWYFAKKSCLKWLLRLQEFNLWFRIAKTSIWNMPRHSFHSACSKYYYFKTTFHTTHTCFHVSSNFFIPKVQDKQQSN